MKIKLLLNKDVNYNADVYFKKAKKLKAKLPGLEKAMDVSCEKIENFNKKKSSYIEKKVQEEVLKNHVKKEWFEKFRWTKTTSGFLFVIGKDSSTNEILIKKHLENSDIVFHTMASGSPFGILKTENKEFSKEDLYECGEFLADFSSQWKKGFGTADVFWVYPNQVTKKAQSGEYIQKGSFMVYGQKNNLKNLPLRLSLGVIVKHIELDGKKIKYEELFSGSKKACLKYCDRFINIEPGNNGYKSLTKEIKNKLRISRIEDLPKYIPNNCKILKK
ncbi:MAG: NFACT RNA binding domain-containing protein [Nanoarchaeota archaeon]